MNEEIRPLDFARQPIADEWLVIQIDFLRARRRMEESQDSGTAPREPTFQASPSFSIDNAITVPSRPV